MVTNLPQLACSRLIDHYDIEGLAVDGKLDPVCNAFWNSTAQAVLHPGISWRASISKQEPSRHLNSPGTIGRHRAMPVTEPRAAVAPRRRRGGHDERKYSLGIRRREAPRLITGTATYTEDVVLPNMAYAAILRSPHAHARIRSLDTSRAKKAPGVLAVFTAADTEAALKPMPCAWLLPNADLKVATYPQLAQDTVRYVGDCVAVVVADDRYQAQDALELIDVDYDPLPVVVDPQKATAKGAPQLHADIAGNQAFHWTVAGGYLDAARQADSW